jgi:ribosomal protein S18 acetylase RimI-like enzyme
MNAPQFEVHPFQPGDEEAVITLWRLCHLLHPLNDPAKDIERKQAFQPELFLVGALAGEIVATVMAGYEGHRGWINYLAVHPDHQRKGFGRAMVAEAETRLHALGCPKINLRVRAENSEVIGFYHRLGYAGDDVVSMGKRLQEDDDRS